MQNALAKISASSALRAAWDAERRRLRKSCYGIDRISGRQFETEQGYHFYRLRERLRSKFKSDPLLAIAKPKQSGGNRIICVPTVGDRVVQFAILNEIKSALADKGLLNSVSYGLVANAGRTVQDARARAIQLKAGGKWVYKADIEKFFDNIPREAMKEAIRKIVPHRSLHRVLIAFVETEISDGFDPNWQQIVAQAGIVSGQGVRQGMPLSPYFAGILLRDLDKLIEKRKFPALRYVDDIIAFFSTKEECVAFDAFLRAELSKLALTLGVIGDEHSKTKIFSPTQCPDFLGMELDCGPDGVEFLKISQKTIEKIGQKFLGMASIDELLQKGVTLPTLGSRLDAMERGYVSAYQGGKNLDELKSELAKMKQACLASVLEEIFGLDALKLSSKKQRFLGIA
ncbi:MAG: reverse transcriptase domain-containing protein [Croceibacterium sp.]